jgi:hypothetical protein
MRQSHLTELNAFSNVMLEQEARCFGAVGFLGKVPHIHVCSYDGCSFF